VLCDVDTAKLAHACPPLALDFMFCEEYISSMIKMCEHNKRERERESLFCYKLCCNMINIYIYIKESE